MPPTVKTAIIARTPSISIIDRPTEQASLRGVQRRSNLTKPAPLAPVILGLVPSILWHQERCNRSPREGEGDALASGEGYLKNMQKVLNKRHKPKPETSYLSPHPAGCGRRVSMTLLLKTTHIDIACAMALWILRRGTSSREYRRRMTPKVEAEKRVDVPSVSLLLNVLFPNMSFFLPNPEKTC